MRVPKKEREENARAFYHLLMNGTCNKAAVVVKRTEGSNPNINRCQFFAALSKLSGEEPKMIAESTLGIEGCFFEFLSAVRACRQTTFYEEGFQEWLKETYGIEIVYWDGLVLIFERREEK